MNEATIFPAPRATSSRLGLMLYPYLAAFCLAETILSKNPAIAINLHTVRIRMESIVGKFAYTAVDVVLWKYRKVFL